MIKVGIAGAGFMGLTHAKVYANLENAEVTAVADISSDKAREAAKVLNASSPRMYSSADDMIYESGVDVVDICLPTFLHAKYTVMAAKAGKHILCEKPMALSLSQADTMIESSKETGVKFMVAQVIRFWPEYQVLKNVFDSGRIGSMKSLSCRRLSKTPTWSWKNWILCEDKSGSAAVDLHIHDVDYVSYLLGKPLSVYSQGTAEHIYTIYEYPKERLSVFAEGGWDLPDSFPFRMTYSAVFEKGFVEFQSDREPSLAAYPAEELKHLTEKTEPTIKDVLEDGNISEIQGYYNEIKYFTDCIDRDTHPTVVTPEQARTALEVNLKEIASLKCREKVYI